MSRFGSPSGSHERVDSIGHNGIEMQKYHDEEITEQERDGLLDNSGSYRRRDNAPRSRRIVSPLLFAVFGPSDRLRSYIPNKPSDSPNATIAIVEDICGCGTSPFGSALCTTYSAPALERSRLYTGTGARTRRFLDVAQQRPVKVGVLGGSVSACHGVDTDSMGKSCYARRIVDWMREKLYGGKEDGVIAVNGAIGGMDSSYYAFCGTHHVPLDVDLLILEFDVNDQPIVLEFPNKPAVLVVGAWGPQLSFDYGYMDPSVTHLPAVQYYDVPYISLGGFDYCLPGETTMSSQHFGVLNETHVGGGRADATLGHEPSSGADAFNLVRLPPSAELVHNRTDDGETTDTHIPSYPTLKTNYFHRGSLTLPSAPLPATPFCADANDEAHPLMPSDKYGGSHGWEKHIAHGGKHSYATDEEGSREVVWALEKKMNVPSVAYIDSLVTPGDHYVTCEVIEETANPKAEKPHHFRIIAVMAT
ncbi:hypothetical protein RHS01_09577 [Rhizoctonia solani]|uniref:Uncharacterized protein n=1 Tax=Rhizoctonia solani TaxID=456999 RepID=A0A8H7I6T3_9AGAM|nr:hypothetical protein RHS01_09577 [Rhizoctonia solani]